MSCQPGKATLNGVILASVEEVAIVTPVLGRAAGSGKARSKRLGVLRVLVSLFKRFAADS